MTRAGTTMPLLPLVQPDPLVLLPEGAPLAVQYLCQAQHLLPPEVLTHPGSRQFRRALRDLAAALPVHLLPSRTETRRALDVLDAAGALAPWVGREVQR